jgi:hypothetical protein
VTPPAVSAQPRNTEFATVGRRAALQVRCEQQRREWALQVGDIESRLRGTDAVLGSIRAVMTRPVVLAGGLVTLLLTVSRSGWWPMLSRGTVLFAAGRRIYNFIKHK